jgi:hypothetical protein
VSVVGWVAEALVAAWQRQEHEGRYRGADDFRALHIDPSDALGSWQAAVGAKVAWPDALPAGFDTLELPEGLGLDRAERLLVVLAAAVELEPRLRPLVAALTDDPALRQPTVALAAELAGAVGLGAAAIRAALEPQGRLALLDLVRVEPVAGRPSRLDWQLVATDWLTGVLDGVLPARPARLRRFDGHAGQVGGRPVALAGADHVRHAEAWGQACALGSAADAQQLADLLRVARLNGDGILVSVEVAPERWLVEALEHAAQLGWPVGISVAIGTTWVPPAGWRQRNIPMAGVAERAARWRADLAGQGLLTEDETITRIAVEYSLGLEAIDEAVTRVTTEVEPGPLVVELPVLRLAARRTAWRDLSSCARPGPTGNTWDDLVVTESVRRQLLDVAAAIGQRGRVLDEWGFGSRPGSRGYHVLFAGPSGTGKTMSAGVVAEATGLELWVVDLARVVDKYLGETEKAIDKVLRAAESSGAMLLFDEADALFGRRGEVREAKDRWANVEVAFLLQRIEEHDGVTVLTTNVSHHLDEAFARRMSQRVEFTVPDARLRRTLWQRSIPGTAPLADEADLVTVAEQFELAGGAIRTAALNAAYAAAADTGSIGLPHLVRASVRELSKAGRTPTRSDLGELGIHLGEAG